jgi:hypothetical protein
MAIAGFTAANLAVGGGLYYYVRNTIDSIEEAF